MNDPKLLHPAPEQLADYGLGRLSEPDSAAVYDHLEVCAECRRTVETLPDDTLASLVRAATVPGLPPGPGGERGASPAGNTLLPDPTPQGGGTVAYSPDQGSRAPDPSATAPAPRDDVSRAAGPSAAAEGDTEHIPAPLLDHPRYRIVELLGAGGMGSVYQAEHLLMGRTVALKVIARQLVARPAMLERFRREVRAAARLAHPNIVHAYDAEQAGDTHFLVMEFVEGTSLDRLVQERGPLPVAQACDDARQAALGLEHAYRRGMVHRDIKPHNLMLTPEGQVKVLDFGLARFASENLLASPLTEAGTVMGTPDYIAPEQARDAHSADIRADLYSLGCTLYFLLTGQPPFPEGTYVQKLAAHLERAPRPLSELRRDLSPGLARIVQRMMAKDPAQRYQTPAEVAEALAPFARPAEVPARPGRRRWPLVAAAVLLGLLGVGAYLFAPAVYRFATNQGEVVIETDDPDVEVSVKHGGKQIEILDGKTKRKVTLQAGTTYQVALTEGKEGLRLSTKQFTLERGGREIVKVRLEEGAWAKGHAAEKGRDTEPAQGRPGERQEGSTLPPPTLLAPPPGAVLGNGRADRTQGISWLFRWSEVPGASHYHLFVLGPGAAFPAIDRPDLTSPEYRHEQPGSYIAEHNRRGWQWKVRARVNGSWTRWSEARNFDVAPLDDGPRRSALSAPGVRVLIDATKDGGVWWFPQGQAGFDAAKPHQGGRLATYLREAGCQVRELGRDLADVSGEIKDVDLVIRFGDFQPPTAKEARAYKDFVERGGALLLVAGSRRDPPPPDPIAEAFGLRFERTVGGTAIDRWANHPATQGLGPTPFMAGSVVTKVPNSATPLGWLEEQGGAPKGGWLVMGARNVGKGKVIFLSSQFLLLNVQQPLMDRVFAFLIGKPGQPMSREGATLRGRR